MSRHQPLVSVVIPAFERPERLRACIAALARQDLAMTAFEVVVVDDGSKEPLEEHARASQGNLDLTILRQANGGPAKARNRGAKAARGDLLVLTDDDCRPQPSWLRSLLSAHEAAPDALLGGRTVNALPDNVFAAASQDLVDYLYAYFERTRGTPVFFTSNNMAMARGHFLELGGFDESFPLAAGEDRELCDHWRHRGWPLRFVKEAVVDHAHALTAVRFWRQHSNYGRGAQSLDQTLQASGRPRHSREPLSFYMGLLASPLRHGPIHTRPVRAVLLAVSQLAVVTGFYHAAWSDTRPIAKASPGCTSH